MIKNFKLFEVIGLVAILFVWMADWHSVRRWNDVESGYWRFIESFHGAMRQASSDIGQGLQFAINRALQGKEVDYSRPDAAYVSAWYSAEVRSLWLTTCVNSFFRADNTIRELLDVANNNKLNVRIDVDRLNSLGDEAKKSLVPLIDASKGPMARQVPSEQDVSAYDAGRIDQKLRDFNASIAEPINEIGQGIKASKNRASAVYRVIFALGSLLLVTAKACDWVGSTRVAQRTRLPGRTSGVS
jgi:hypothetical protein